MTTKIPLAEPDVTGNEQKYLSECISTGYVSSVGKFVNLFEERIAETVDAKYCVAVNSGTSALHLSLLALGVKNDDLVILPSLTFIASANAISYCGASPWLFDVSETDWCLDANLLETTLKKETIFSEGKLIHKESNKTVSAIMPVYTNGTPANIDAISKIAQKYGLPVIADAAAAIGAKYEGNKTGNLNADLTTYSFNGNKTITSGGGGAIVGNNKEILERIKHLSTTARVGRNYDHDVVGFNYRMTNIQAAVGCAQIERLDDFIQNKKFIKASYKKIVDEIADIFVIPENDNTESACWLSGIVVGRTYDIDTIQNQLNEAGVESRQFWKPVHLQKPYANSPKTQMNICENLWNRVLILPSSSNLSKENINFVVNKTIEIFKENGAK